MFHWDLVFVTLQKNMSTPLLSITPLHWIQALSSLCLDFEEKNQEDLEMFITLCLRTQLSITMLC